MRSYLGFTFVGFLRKMITDSEFSDMGIQKFETISGVQSKYQGSQFFQRGSSIFVVSVEESERSVILHDIFCSDGDVYNLAASYIRLKKNSQRDGGAFFDTRFLEGDYVDPAKSRSIEFEE